MHRNSAGADRWAEACMSVEQSRNKSETVADKLGVGAGHSTALVAFDHKRVALPPMDSWTDTQRPVLWWGLSPQDYCWQIFVTCS